MIKRNWNNGILVLGFLLLGVSWAQAQAIAESAAANSQSGMAGQGAKASLVMPDPQKQAKSPHLFAENGPPPDEQNRKDFEQNAGEKAGKLLLRSAPSGADVFINDRIVGRTPLLIIIAPGKYEVDMRGSRGDRGHAVVGLMPKETQTVVITLSQRYPAAVSIR